MEVRSFDRFDLRNSAEFFCRSTLEEVASLRSAPYFYNLDSLTVKGQIEAEAYEVTTEVALNGSTNRWIRTYLLPTDDPLLDFLAEDGGFELEFTLRSKHLKSIDAVYTFGDDTDTGQITLVAELPLSDLTRLCDEHGWLRGLLAHEMQHLVQRVIYGHKFNLSNGARLQDHMVDAEEIDARIEEIVASQSDDSCTVDPQLFRRLLSDYVDEYLKRNSLPVGSDLFQQFKNKMMDVHMINFRKKFQLWG